MVKRVKDKTRPYQLIDKDCLEKYQLCEKTKILQEKLDSLVYNDIILNHNLIIDSNDKDSS